MANKQFKAEISDYVLQRGTGKPVERNKAIVYDFMPVILGEMFRTDEILSKMLLRPPPVTGPFMLQAKAYEKLGLIYVMQGELIPALECYRISLDSKMAFKKYVGDIQENALLNHKEMEFLEKPNDMEKKLVSKVLNLNLKPDRNVYNSWVEELRATKSNTTKQNGVVFNSPERVEAYMGIGEYAKALSIAEGLNLPELIIKVQTATPDEILDTKYLYKYMLDHHPQSNFGSGW
jgi:hypothetical protein